ncbi:hypothetical protein BU26DRAFT_515890 [Trematosphaeria pertusa]|uniref:SPT2-domain-containing protein n=1 Tax=Trematosphaeria pertusa TaxID=390896 RepID=A0A6A6IWH4_9PLEO|nr:uncharacterized protein BU26DRAFT_515890 [Trematosphaeria pertusa]KAF2253553.1 hypothetical protein BU26DRAFT_515890 [Trematosphaeria pertusa]
MSVSQALPLARGHPCSTSQLFKDLISSIDPTAARPSQPVSTVAQTPSSGPPKPVPRPVASADRAQSPALKRKASGPVDSGHVKIQRKDALPQTGQANGAARPAAPSGPTKPNPPASSTTGAYRGTAGLSAPRPANMPVKKPNAPSSTQTATPKAVAPALKPAGVVPASAAPAPAPTKKPGGYLAILQKAKEKDQTKPLAPPIKHEAPKIMTKREREQARLNAKAAAKGKKPSVAIPAKAMNGKGGAEKEKKKPVELGYQGTARPAKKPVELGYKGTARPSASAAPAGRPGASAAKAKSKVSQGRYGGYASWSDEELEEEDYESEDDLSDMEGGIWDVEQEEQAALKAAKQEDAEALAEEAELKRQKEERKRKLMAMSKAAANKRKY